MTRKSITENERIYVVFNFCDATKDFTLSEHIKGWRGALKPTQLIFTTLEKARSKIPKDHYSRENCSREYYIKKD